MAETGDWSKPPNSKHASKQQVADGNAQQREQADCLCLDAAVADSHRRASSQSCPACTRYMCLAVTVLYIAWWDGCLQHVRPASA